MKSIQPLRQTLLQQSTYCRPSTSTCRAVYLQTPNTNSKRTFISNPFSSNQPQTLTATRTLQYPHKTIYAIISDVSSYSTFLPYCAGSTVTKTSSPHPKTGKTYPEEGKLVIGFNGDVSEEFWSRVYCVPDTVVEAVSGNSETTLPAEEVSHHSQRPPAGSDDKTRNAKVLTHLLTRWSLKPFPYKPPPASATHPSTTHMNHAETSEIPGQEKTEVSLHMEFQFANPVYGALSQAAAPKVAEKMIEAFETRVKAIIEGPGNVGPTKSKLEGVISKGSRP